MVGTHWTCVNYILCKLDIFTRGTASFLGSRSLKKVHVASVAPVLPLRSSHTNVMDHSMVGILIPNQY
jgi:hypothetical protein